MSKFKKFLLGTDIHGDKQDPGANRVFFEFEKLWKPEIRICGGDLWDFRPLRKKASREEQAEDMKPDFAAGMKWFEKFRPTHYLRGNHCERLWELLDSNLGLERGFAEDGVKEITGLVRKMGCKMLPYHKRDGVLQIGHLKVLHGFFTGAHAAKETATVYGSCLFGHAHAIESHPVPGLERRMARQVGCLCKLDMPYNARHVRTLRHAHGFAYGVVNKDSGAYHVFQAEEVNGVWALPSDIVTL
jgi:hypothetical protein